MSRKSKSKHTPTTRLAWLTRRVAVGSIAGVLVLLAGGLIFADWYRCLPPDTKAVYVGRQSCIQCHQDQAAKFAHSHHDQAMDRATPQTVLGDFNNAEFTYFDIKNRMYRDGERYMIHTEGPDGQPGDFEVKYVLGVDPLQNYMVEFDPPEDAAENEVGRLQVLRVTWDTLKQEWFYLPPPDVADKLAPHDELHWTGVAQRWNTMCADCHSTNVAKNFNTQSLRYHTTFSEIDVSCEACHGPGSTHVQLAQANSLFWDRKLGYGLTAKMKDAPAENEIQVCAECHARREVIADNYDPGDDFWNHYSTELIGRLTYHADGQIEDEDFEHGSFLQSKMYHKGIRCTDCHDPHSAKPKHDGNKLCTSCHQHPAGKYDTPLHHHHKEGGTGASCVACHMPTTTYMEVHVRHDHSLRVPRPDLSVALGTPNACTACHLDQKKLKEEVRAAESKLKPDRLQQYLHFVQAARQGDPTVQKELARLDQWSTDAVEKWYGKKPIAKENPKHFAYAIAAARQADPAAEALLKEVVGNRLWPAFVRASALQEWQQYNSPEMYQASAQSLQDKNPLVRAAAAANFFGASRAVRLKSLPPLLHDPDFIVSRLAARALADVRSDLKGEDRNQLTQLISDWVEGLMENSDRGGVHLAIGSLEEQLGDMPAAADAYREAIRVEPNLVGARANLAAVLEARLTQDRSLDNSDRAKLLTEVDQLRAAEFELLARDARLVPDNAAVQYRYGLALYLRNEIDPALAAIKHAVELEPRTIDFRLAYVLLLQKVGKIPEAIEQMNQVIVQRPDDIGAQRLLAELKLQQKQKEEK